MSGPSAEETRVEEELGVGTEYTGRQSWHLRKCRVRFKGERSRRMRLSLIGAVRLEAAWDPGQVLLLGHRGGA